MPWNTAVPETDPGVYTVTLTPRADSAVEARAACPLPMSAVGELLAARSKLRVDGARPGANTLATRLAGFWLPDEVDSAIAEIWHRKQPLREVGPPTVVNRHFDLERRRCAARHGSNGGNSRPIAPRNCLGRNGDAWRVVHSHCRLLPLEHRCQGRRSHVPRPGWTLKRLRDTCAIGWINRSLGLEHARELLGLYSIEDTLPYASLANGSRERRIKRLGAPALPPELPQPQAP